MTQKNDYPRLKVGVSGFAAYVPPYRVRLSEWCKWRNENYQKLKEVVGSSFRMRGPNENAYTMAATAVRRLIEQYSIDPQKIGYLALGTESSTDNSAGAIIIKGMVNDALSANGKPKINRDCEVPEFKHACLGGMYAMKAVARYLALDGKDKVGIVVCSDIAEYEPFTSGEPTQGAGAVAILIEENPSILNLELENSGTSSEYRGSDFRKPFYRFLAQKPGHYGQLRDFPIFNGRYSTMCYIDAVLKAMENMFGKVGIKPSKFLEELSAIFLHRPYQRMAETGLIMSYFLALALGDSKDRKELDNYAKKSKIETSDLVNELTGKRNIECGTEGFDLAKDIFPLAQNVASEFRKSSKFKGLMTNLGLSEMQQVGNLYTASLPAWIAAGLEKAATNNIELHSNRILTIGYGSGDAAEIIPMELTPKWKESASNISFGKALQNPIDIDEETYISLHSGKVPKRELIEAPKVFYIDKIGTREGVINDFGIEYYKFS